MRRSMRLAFGLLFTLLACERASSAGTGGDGGDAATGTGGTAAAFDPCKRCGSPSERGKLQSPDALEVSGIAASALHPGTYFIHNDSGDTPRFFATDETGKELARYDVDGAFAIDWEDAAAGPCPEGRCLYFADIGDNLGKRTSYAVYRVAEPAAIEAGTHHVASEPLTFTYPDGSHDAETLLAHPQTGELFVVTKEILGPSSVYRFPMPLTPGKSAVLEKVGEVPVQGAITRFTGGSIHPKGRGVLLRSYTSLYYYPIVDTVAAALAAPPCTVPVASEKQGESVEWTATGDGYLTISEGTNAPVHVTSCP